MNGSERAAARERRFTAELAAALHLPIDAVVEQAAPPRQSAAWTRAAIVLFGVCMTVYVAMQASDARRPAQQPVALDTPRIPCAAFTARAAELGSLSTGLEHIRIHLDFPDDFFARIDAFDRLRMLDIEGPWNEAAWPASSTAALAQLPRLEVLGLPLHAEMGADHLRALAKVPELRYLTLRLGRALQVDDVRALATLPGLVSLQLCRGSIDLRVVRELSTLPQLQVLALQGVKGCDEPTLAQVRFLHPLRRLRLDGLGEVPRARRLLKQVADGAGLTAAVSRSLRELPCFESLELNACEVTAAAVDALPRGLSHVSLTNCPDAGPEVYAAMLRLPHLRRLGLNRIEHLPPTDFAGITPAASVLANQEQVWPLQAELLALPGLREFQFAGSLPLPLREAMQRAAGLRAIDFVQVAASDVSAAVGMPALERLRLEDCQVSVAEMQTQRTTSGLPPLQLVWVQGGRPEEQALLSGKKP